MMFIRSRKIIRTAVKLLICKSNMSNFAVEKEKFLKMSFQEKRQFYAKPKYVELKDVSSWTEYYNSNKSKLQEKLQNSDFGKNLAISPSVNIKFNDIVSIWKGDITQLEIDTIVNAANSSLLGGGGVDGAIHRAAGPLLKAECSTLKGCSTGQAKITGGYKLPARYVIHTVGPRGEKPDLLESCYNNSLNLLVENDLRSIAFPCISTGIYGYPQDKAAHVALKTVKNFLEKNSNKVDKVIFTLFLEEDVNIYETLMQLYFPL